MSSSSPKLSLTNPHTQTQPQSTTPTQRHPNLPATTPMLERALSSRRVNSHGDVDGDGDEALNGDDSKTKKQQNILFRFTNRASNYFSRTVSFCGQYLPCIAIALLLLLASSFLYTSRSFVCISSSSFYHPVSRAGFFGLDGLDSDFGTLGVPWCKSLFADLILFC